MDLELDKQIKEAMENAKNGYCSDVEALLNSDPCAKYVGHYPNPDWETNPPKNWPRNANCFCGSGIKYKKCCLVKPK